MLIFDNFGLKSQFLTFSEVVLELFRKFTIFLVTLKQHFYLWNFIYFSSSFGKILMKTIFTFLVAKKVSAFSVLFLKCSRKV